jgi:flagellar assembly factor FliW
MPSFQTQNFGLVSYDAAAPVEFPAGLPGFEARRRFLALSFPDSQPLIFLQSLEDAGLCFLTLPALVADPQYRVEISQEDRACIGFTPTQPVRIGQEVLCLAILSLREEGPTANLLAEVRHEKPEN